jgi:hypothetical protein
MVERKPPTVWRIIIGGGVKDADEVGQSQVTNLIVNAPN